MAALALALVWSGCTTTIIPDPVRDAEASWDANVQNSGLIALLEDGSALITPHARDRYNALIAVYGPRFAPPLQSDAGVQPQSPTGFVMDAEHLVMFATMNRWRKQAQP